MPVPGLVLVAAPDEVRSVVGCDAGAEDSVDGVDSEGVESDGVGVDVDGVGVEVEGAGESVDGHGDGVRPLTGAGGRVPVTVTHGSGDDGEVDGDVEVEDEVDADGVGVGAGGVVGWSCRPLVSPGCRAIQRSVCGSTMTKTLITVTEGLTTTTLLGRKPGQAAPTCFGARCATGGVSGLPQAQRTRGTPWSSTRTAVPAWSTDWKGVALPLVKPWLVTRVSTRS